MRILPLFTALALLATPFATPLAAQNLRVMSYNIRVDVESDTPRWAERKGPMIAQIRREAPDILGVQEAAQSAVADLAAGLPDYDHYGIGRDDGVKGETTTIFYRRDRLHPVSTDTEWCSATPHTPGKDADAAYPRTITRIVFHDATSNRMLDVRNTHFDHVGVVARENCARQIEATPATGTVIVMGDFNTGPDSAPYRLLSDTEGLNLKDARIGAEQARGPVGTFNGFDLTKTDGEAIDHIFVDRAVTISRYDVLTEGNDGKVISDHFPVVVDIRLPK